MTPDVPRSAPSERELNRIFYTYLAAAELSRTLTIILTSRVVSILVLFLFAQQVTISAVWVVLDALGVAFAVTGVAVAGRAARVLDVHVPADQVGGSVWRALRTRSTRSAVLFGVGIGVVSAILTAATR